MAIGREAVRDMVGAEVLCQMSKCIRYLLVGLFEDLPMGILNMYFLQVCLTRVSRCCAFAARFYFPRRMGCLLWLQQSILECVRELNDRTSAITTNCGLTADNSSIVLIVSLVTSERGCLRIAHLCPTDFEAHG